MIPPRLLRGFLAIAVWAADQGSKTLVLHLMHDTHEPVRVWSWFHWVLVWNKGISFGLLHDHAWLQTGLLTLISTITLGCGWWAWRVRDTFQGILWSLIFGGALGNLTDRFRWGAVIDFIDWSYGDLHWPAFNLADSVLTVCSLVLCFPYLSSGSNPSKKDT